MRRAAHALLAMVLLAGCATGRAAAPASPDGAQPGSMATAHALCDEMARREERSPVFRASLALGAAGSGIMTLYAAMYGALWGAAIGGGRSEGAWIGAAAGASVGIVLGVLDGIARAETARARYRAAYDVCLGALEQTAAPDGERASPE